MAVIKYLENGEWKSLPIIQDISDGSMDNIINTVKTKIISNDIPVYPIGTIYTTTSSENPSNTLGGTWELYKKYGSIDWCDFTNMNATYINNSAQSSYTLNKWCVKENILYINIGAGASSTIDTSEETELARIPLQNTGMGTSANSTVWNAAVGTTGIWGGFAVSNLGSYLRIKLKPHTSSNGAVAKWFSTFFVIPISEDWTTTSTENNVVRNYLWKRVA